MKQALIGPKTREILSLYWLSGVTLKEFEHLLNTKNIEGPIRQIFLWYYIHLVKTYG